MYTENFYYGKGKNPADELPKWGKKNDKLERNMMEIIQKEQKDKADEEERIRNMRYFETTTG